MRAFDARFFFFSFLGKEMSGKKKKGKSALNETVCGHCKVPRFSESGIIKNIPFHGFRMLQLSRALWGHLVP